MPNPTKAKYVIAGCDRRCSIHDANLPPGLGQQIHQWYEDGMNRDDIRAKALETRTNLSVGSIGRHKKNHLHPEQADLPAAPDGSHDNSETPERQLSELDILNAIIQRGGQRMKSPTTNVTTEQTMTAIAMKQKLTEGNVFDDMFKALFETEDDDMSDLIPAPDPALDLGPHENPLALESTDEDPPE